MSLRARLELDKNSELAQSNITELCENSIKSLTLVMAVQLSAARYVYKHLCA